MGLVSTTIGVSMGAPTPEPHSKAAKRDVEEMFDLVHENPGNVVPCLEHHPETRLGRLDMIRLV